MSDPGFKDGSAAGLRLRLYDGPLDRNGIGVLATGSAGGCGVRLEAAVIGASHLIEVRTGGSVFTEMLACRPAPSAAPAAEVAPGRGEVERTLPCGARYRFRARTVAWPQPQEALERLRERIRRCAAEPSEVGLTYRFPGGPVSADYSAETLVFAAARADAVVARTAHCYPSEGLVVLSSSRIALRPVDSGRRAGEGPVRSA